MTGISRRPHVARAQRSRDRCAQPPERPEPDPAELWNAAGQVLPGRRQPHFGGKVQKAAGLARPPQLRRRLPSFLDEWSGEAVRRCAGATAAARSTSMSGAPAPDALRMMYCDAVSYLPDDILCKVDRASMAVSLETRVPFLDHRVAELAARIPLSIKLRDGGKHILRELLYREAPRELFDRPKAGFAIPVGEWIKGAPSVGGGAARRREWQGGLFRCRHRSTPLA